MSFNGLDILLSEPIRYSLITHIFYGFCLGITLPLSIFTGYVILYKTPKYMGQYRFLILAQLGCSLVFSIAMYLIQPTILLPYTLVISTGPVRGIHHSYLSLLISLVGISVANMGLLSTTSAAYLVFHVSKICGRPEEGLTNSTKCLLVSFHLLPTLAIIFVVQLPVYNGDIDRFFSDIQFWVTNFYLLHGEYSFYGVPMESSAKWILGCGLSILFPITIGCGLYFIRRSKIVLGRLIILKRNTYGSLVTFQYLVRFFLLTPFLLLGLPALYILFSLFVFESLPFESHLNSFVIYPTGLFPILFSGAHLIWIAPYKRYLKQTIRSIERTIK